MSAPFPTRVVAIVSVVVAFAVAAVVLLPPGGGSYRVHARFLNAGQLVEGNLVKVGGIAIGSIDRIGVSRDGQADLTLKITDYRFVPLHAGTFAQIRAAGAAGIANRYVAIAPGPASAAKLADGGSLPSTATRGIVDLDTVLDSLDPITRKRLVAIFGNGAEAFASPEAANRGFHLLNPALSQASLLMSELGRDRRALGQVVASSGRTMRALDARRGDLAPLVGDLATSLETVAAKRDTVRSILTRAVATMQRTRTTLAGLRRALPEVSKMLVALRPAAAPLIRLLRRLGPDARALAPALAQLREQLPAARSALTALPRLARITTPPLRSATRAIRGAAPIFRGIRPYTPELLSTAEWMGGNLLATYDALGHYGRLTPVAGLQGVTGLASALNLNLPASSPVLSSRLNLLAPCPGGAAEPAPDGSNPWVADTSTCDPEDNKR